MASATTKTVMSPMDPPKAPRPTQLIFKLRGTVFGGSHSKDYNILGSILGSPYFGKKPM